MLTKIITQPLKGRFYPVEPNKAEDLVGATCIVTTSEVTTTFGEAELTTEGAPLRLNVRSSEAGIAKGCEVVLVEHDAETNTWQVASFNV